ATEIARQQPSTQEKVQTLIAHKDDKAGDFIWNILKPTLLYSAELVGEIADNIVAIDDAMKWGFGWEIGPFELWDAIGLEKSVSRMKKEEEVIPAWIETLLDEGHKTFYKEENGEVSYYSDGAYATKSFNKK